MIKVWDDYAWEDYLYWQSKDKKTLKRKGPKIAAILDFLLPVETCFWVVHFAYAFVNKRRFK